VLPPVSHRPERSHPNSVCTFPIISQLLATYPLQEVAFAVPNDHLSSFRNSLPHVHDSPHVEIRGGRVNGLRVRSAPKKRATAQTTIWPVRYCRRFPRQTPGQERS
jgi:hypothetical protein